MYLMFSQVFLLCLYGWCTHSNKNLHAAMHDLYVLVVHEAAHDSDVGVALCGADSGGLWHLSPHTAGTVLTPPGVMG